MLGRTRSRTGVRERGTPLDYKKTGPGGSPALSSVPWTRLLVFGLGPDLDGLEMAHGALEAILAPHAGLDLRHDPEPSRRDGLVALHADAVLAVVQPLDGGGQAVHALYEELARREADLTPLVGLDLVHLVGERPVLAAGAEQILECLDSTQLAQPAHRHFQILLQPIPNRVHGVLLISGRPPMQRVCRS